MDSWGGSWTPAEEAFRSLKLTVPISVQSLLPLPTQTGAKLVWECARRRNMLSVLRMSWGAGKEGRRAVWQWENAFVSTGLAFWNWQGAFVFAVVTGYLLTIPKVDLSKLVQGQVNFPAALKPTTTSARMGWLAWAFRRERRGWNFLTGKTCAPGFLCSFTHSLFIYRPIVEYIFHKRMVPFVDR